MPFIYLLSPSLKKKVTVVGMRAPLLVSFHSSVFSLFLTNPKPTRPSPPMPCKLKSPSGPPPLWVQWWWQERDEEREIGRGGSGNKRWFQGKPWSDKLSFWVEINIILKIAIYILRSLDLSHYFSSCTPLFSWHYDYYDSW